MARVHAMNGLLARIEALARSPTRDVVDARLEDFRAFRGDDTTSEMLFKEMCFCILTANTSADLCLRVCDEIGDAFLAATCAESVTALLKQAKYRFYNVRGRYIASACQHAAGLKDILRSFGTDEPALREWLVQNVKGLGYKEASHFMRNVGYENVAIIDFHIVDILAREGIVARPKTMTRKAYLATEGALAGLARRAGLTLAALDLYLWFLETGKVLK